MTNAQIQFMAKSSGIAVELIQMGLADGLTFPQIKEAHEFMGTTASAEPTVAAPVKVTQQVNSAASVAAAPVKLAKGSVPLDKASRQTARKIKHAPAKRNIAPRFAGIDPDDIELNLTKAEAKSIDTFGTGLDNLADADGKTRAKFYASNPNRHKSTEEVLSMLLRIFGAEMYDKLGAFGRRESDNSRDKRRWVLLDANGHVTEEVNPNSSKCPYDTLPQGWQERKYVYLDKVTGWAAPGTVVRRVLDWMGFQPTRENMMHLCGLSRYKGRTGGKYGYGKSE